MGAPQAGLVFRAFVLSVGLSAGGALSSVDALADADHDFYCQDLWYQRNAVFAARGYCFKTTAGHAFFPDSCFEPFGKTDAADKQVVKQIRSLEKRYGCEPSGEAGFGILPIVIGGSFDEDACGGSATVLGLNPEGEGFLAVREAPRGKEVDRLHNGERVLVCNEVGDWMGIVYAGAAGEDPAVCNVGTPWPARSIYTGPCYFGWVDRKYLGDFAG